MATTSRNDRIFYIDSYRGIAALGVAWFHIYTAITDPSYLGNVVKLDSHDTWGILFNYLAVWGRWGVRLFFVISGFVLAFSLQRKYLITSLPSVGRYLIRRSIRLDPAYWFTIALILAMLTIFKENSFLNIHASKPSSLAELITNIFYLNWLMGYKSVMTVSWTLVLEIQLYIVFSLLLYVGYLFSRFAKTSNENAAFTVITAFAILSLLWHFVPGFSISIGVLTGYFYIFMMGVLVYNSFIEKRYLPMLIIYTLVFIYVFIKQHDTSLLAILISSGLIYSTHYISFFRKKVENKYLLYFGKLSYCIYLLHVPVGLVSATLFVKFITKYTGFNIGVHLSAAVFSLATTIIASNFLNRFLEEKSIQWSKKISIAKK